MRNPSYRSSPYSVFNEDTWWWAGKSVDYTEREDETEEHSYLAETPAIARRRRTGCLMRTPGGGRCSNRPRLCQLCCLTLSLLITLSHHSQMNSGWRCTRCYFMYISLFHVDYAFSCTLHYFMYITHYKFLG